MKLQDILESYDLGRRGDNLSPEELEILFNAVSKHGEMSRSEIQNLTRELEEKDMWHRGAFSAELGLARMHVLVHGVAPHGVTEKTAENWMVPSRPMYKFAEKKGLTVDKNIERAKRELAGRKPQLKREDAMKLLTDYVKANRGSIPPEARQYRDQLLGDIQSGLTPEEAFRRVPAAA